MALMLWNIITINSRSERSCSLVVSPAAQQSPRGGQSTFSLLDLAGKYQHSLTQWPDITQSYYHNCSNSCLTPRATCLSELGLPASPLVVSGVSHCQSQPSESPRDIRASVIIIITRYDTRLPLTILSLNNDPSAQLDPVVMTGRAIDISYPIMIMIIISLSEASSS